jgi:hypothetical protein
MRCAALIAPSLLAFSLVLARAPDARSADGDQCEFIREAILALPDDGGLVEVPAGVFECRAMIQLKKSHVRLHGAGRDATTLKLADQSSSPVLVIGDEKIIQNATGDWVTATRVSDIEVSDLTIDGNVANQDVTHECGSGACDGDVANIRNNAITIRGATDVRVLRVTAHSAISGGMVTEKYCDRLTVTDFTSYGNHFDGFAGYQTENSLFENLNLSRNHGAGISIDIDFNRNHFLGGTLASNDDVGIFARDTNEVVFENLSILKSGNHGVFLASSEHPDSCANRNEFRSVVIRDSKGQGLFLADPCVGNRVTGSSVLEGNAKGCFFVNSKTTLDVAPSVTCTER